MASLFLSGLWWIVHDTVENSRPAYVFELQPFPLDDNTLMDMIRYSSSVALIRL